MQLRPTSEPLQDRRQHHSNVMDNKRRGGQTKQQCSTTGEMIDSHSLYDKKVWVWVNCGGDKKEPSSIQTVFQIYSEV